MLGEYIHLDPHDYHFQGSHEVLAWERVTLADRENILVAEE